jgi:hypothetical protein
MNMAAPFYLSQSVFGNKEIKASNKNYQKAKSKII